MKIISEELVSLDNLFSSLQLDETLVVLSSETKDAVIEKIKAKCSLPMTKTQHGVDVCIGTTPSGHGCLLVSWKDTKNLTFFEKRWLLGTLANSVKSNGAKSVALFLSDEGCRQQLIMAEDLYGAFCDSIDVELKLASFRILSQKKIRENDADFHRSIRSKYFVDFKKWINANPDEMTSLEIASRLEVFSKRHQCTYQVLDDKEIVAKGLNLLAAVGQASIRSPSRLILLSHGCENSKEAPLLLVGKGVTFDTGGINVKPHDRFVNCMKNDMGGAALLSQVFMALVESGYDRPLALAVPACENLVAQNSMKPGSVVKAYNGKNVVIEHTDAEGRLILADALSYAEELFQPRQIVVAATLTTSAMTQFSNFYTPGHFLDESQKSKLSEVGESWGELFTFWNEFLPFANCNNTPITDLTNMGRMPGALPASGGSMIAAHFLKNFCTAPMVHFDIFASTWNWSGTYPGPIFGATGAPFNSLFEWTYGL